MCQAQGGPPSHGMVPPCGVVLVRGGRVIPHSPCGCGVGPCGPKFGARVGCRLRVGTGTYVHGVAGASAGAGASFGFTVSIAFQWGSARILWNALFPPFRTPRAYDFQCF